MQSSRASYLTLVFSVLFGASMTTHALAQPGWVLSQQKISDTEGGFTGALNAEDEFGCSVASLGDHNGDGVTDLAVGVLDDDGGPNRGAVWVLFLDGVSCDPCDTNCDGSVDLTDVEAFIGLLIGGPEPCSACAGDTTGDGSVDLTDVQGFIECLLG